MKIVIGRPPQWIWDKAHELFEVDDSGTTYAYAETIYNPAGINLPIEIIEHEETHRRQQRDMGGADVWWKRYFEDPVFRAAMEAEAYGRQYQIYCRRQPDRNRRAAYLFTYASILSGKQYGINMSLSDARKAIQHAAGV